MITPKHSLCHPPNRDRSRGAHASTALALGLVSGILVLRTGFPQWMLLLTAVLLGVGIMAGPRRLHALCRSSLARPLAIFGLAAALGVLRAGVAEHAAQPAWLQSHIEGAEDAGTVYVRGVVVSEPYLRSRSRVSLTLVTREARFEDEDDWRTTGGEYLDLSVYTRRSATQSGCIEQDLPELTAATACGTVIEAEARFNVHFKTNRAQNKSMVPSR